MASDCPLLSLLTFLPLVVPKFLAGCFERISASATGTSVVELPIAVNEAVKVPAALAVTMCDAPPPSDQPVN